MQSATSATKPSEGDLDEALNAAFKASKQFCTWFLEQTKFSDVAKTATYLWSRCDHPWGAVTVQVVDPTTGITAAQRLEGETDVLVVFEEPTIGRFALHIENKLAAGKFTRLQPELYAARSIAWRVWRSTSRTTIARPFL